MKFTKMHGIGNDYIYVDCFLNNIDFNVMRQEIVSMSDRNKGIGGDGVIFIMPSKVADAKMVMFNADGSEGEMCGNGIRCVGKYVYEHGISKNNPMVIETAAGLKTLDLQVENDFVNFVSVNMGSPALAAKDIPVKIDTDKVINYPLTIADMEYRITCVSMGNPHCVIFLDDIETLNLEKVGPFIENADIFPERTNVEFVSVVNDKKIKMRVWERGSGETLACGTGSCAAVVAAVYNGILKFDTEIEVHLKGGELYVTFGSDNLVTMKGSATEVFSGEYELKLHLD